MEIRKDYILDRYVIVSSVRAKRPHEFKNPEEKEEKICYFCPGNEGKTPPEIGRAGKKDGWDIRWFPNKFPAVEEKGNPEFTNADTFFTYAQPYGNHEVIVETSDHKKQLSDLSEEEIKQVLKVYAQRIAELSKKEHIKYVNVFKNHGKDAGTSLVHSHTQIIAYNKTPTLVNEKIQAIKKFDSCPYESIISIEKDSDRRCFENNNFVAFTPYASRFHFEIWIFPKKHIKNITEMDDDELTDLSSILKEVLNKLAELNTPYNFQLFYAPQGEDLHFHIEICPRLAIWAGFELLTNETINSVSPENAAKFYRGET